ncbi:MAG: flagellar basal body P-ring protein FlgI, partial [Planctomycetota bacterium]
RVIRILDELYREYGMGAGSLDQYMGTESVALVMINSTIPATGTREGNRLDCTISTLGEATSLEGGVLQWTILKPGPRPEPVAFATGRIVADPANPTTGQITDGVQMLIDVRTSPVGGGDGTIRLVVKDQFAGVPVATSIRDHINQHFSIDDVTAGDVQAEVDDASTVVLHLYGWARQDPMAALDQVLTLHIDQSQLQTKAKVIINRTAGTITFTGNVEIAPVVVSTRNLLVTQIVPEPPVTPANPKVESKVHVAIQATDETTARSRARLEDLLEALDALKMPFDDRVAVLESLHEQGSLFAELIIR